MRWCLVQFYLLLAGAAYASTQRKPSVPPGFVTTRGTLFELDGKPFVRRASLHSFPIG